MSRLRHLLAALLCLIALPVLAQGLAQGLALTGPGVLDQARLLTPDQTRALSDRITALDRDTGIQIAVVTQPVRDVMTSPEGYATQLFNNWGVGDATSNDGILILVLPTERFVRIELGKGYPAETYLTAQDIISRTFLPRAGSDMGRAIVDTVNATIDRIALPRAGLAAPEPARKAWDFLWLLPGVMVGGMASLIAWNVIRHRISAPRRACPKCASTKLEAVTLNEPDENGQTLTRYMARCSQCGWFGPDPAPPGSGGRGFYPGSDRAMRSGWRDRGGGGGGGSFGGGSSSGGGASGRW